MGAVLYYTGRGCVDARKTREQTMKIAVRTRNMVVFYIHGYRSEASFRGRGVTQGQIGMSVFVQFKRNERSASR